MSLSLFKLIRGVLRFDNVETRQGCLARDKLAAVRMLLDDFVEHSKLAYVPGSSITVDKQLFPYRRALQIPAIRAYMPSKPERYGLKFWLACDSEKLLIYCSTAIIYRFTAVARTLEIRKYHWVNVLFYHSQEICATVEQW